MTASPKPEAVARDEYEGLVTELVATYERPYRALLLAGVVIFLAFGLREIAIYGDRAGPVLLMRGGFAAGLLLLALLARRFRGEAALWLGVAYLGLFATGICATAALSPNGWVMHALAGLSMLVVAFGPLWPRPRLFVAGTVALLLPPLAMLWLIAAPGPTWLDYVSYLSVAACVAYLLFRLSQGLSIRDYRLRRELLRRADSDALTGVLNRAGWGSRAEQLMDVARQSALPLVMLYLDLDHFKQVNDRYGHATGDEVLERAALAIRSTLREQDLVARLGGEEFVVMLPGASIEQALAVAERIRLRVSEANAAVRITLSGGLAAWDRVESLDDLMHRADLAMIEAKRAGRNRVVAAD
ncbi:GGDEF domain-containing protein [Rehaibacterium terrae]|jgi:diguanylate cyclase (GGDEF)-like protein|uniref:diguanylate cyclase n=1 Tax=Rehaibacterium terrae TaxID=1341696 RepID=A0A7W7Y205_9GAMM|nr:GGDEF domain-containing protein [Rehaibacterium terrae]MBB5016378.1 diguanylate cyclase (GGDEF)-like protein [Rehaibacterium terrae]